VVLSLHDGEPLDKHVALIARLAFGLEPMHDIKLVVADVDGCLVTREKVLTDRALAAVAALRRAGVKIVLTSGRPPRGMAMLVDPLHVDLPMAAFNGGAYVRPDLSAIDVLTIAPDTAARIVQTMEQHGLDAWLYRADDWLVRKLDAPHVAREQWTVKFPPTVVPALDGHFDQIVKIVGVSDDPATMARCLTDIHEQFPGVIFAALSQPYYLDVTHPDANKGRVVEWFSRFLHIPLEQVAAIGDMPNDVPMFSRVGLGIAMGNSSAEVKRQADAVTTSSEDEGFANAMFQHVLGEEDTREQ
jgi:Cof subfamily protein (haloacid dehalogenase superfamily)